MRLALALIVLGGAMSWAGILYMGHGGPPPTIVAMTWAGIATLAVGVLRGAFLLGRWLGRLRGPRG